ncbi:kinase-like domain-containing protein [Rhizophagus clarus]|nr:kinase-like domain-containing protein [Rhizophagus clarus]
MPVMASIMAFYQINYNDMYFLKREETAPTTLYIFRVVQPVIRMTYDDDDVNFSYNGYDDSNDSESSDIYVPSGKRKGTSKISSKKQLRLSKGIATIDEYIVGGSFGKVVSGY